MEEFLHGMEIKWKKNAGMNYGKIIFRSILCHAVSTEQHGQKSESVVFMTTLVA